jgi:hypothetical protein
VPVEYTEGDRVEGDFKGKGVWCPGVVTCNREVSTSAEHRGGAGLELGSELRAHFRNDITLDIFLREMTDGHIDRLTDCLSVCLTD